LIQGALTTGDNMLEEIALTKIANIVFEKYQKLKDQDKNKITLVEFPTTNFSYTELDDATTNKEEFDKDNPDLKITNPYKKTCLVKEILIVPDDSFKTNGMIEVYIGDEIIFRNKKVGNFSKVVQSEIKLKRGKTIKPNESVKAFLKGSDGVSVGIALEVTFGD